MEQKTELKKLDTTKTNEKIDAITKRAESQARSIETAFNSEVTFNIKVLDNDTLLLNKDKVRATSVKKIIDSAELKTQAKEKLGLDFNKMIAKTEKVSNYRIKAFAENSIKNLMRKTAKEIF